MLFASRGPAELDRRLRESLSTAPLPFQLSSCPCCATGVAYQGQGSSALIGGNRRPYRLLDGDSTNETGQTVAAADAAKSGTLAERADRCRLSGSPAKAIGGIPRAPGDATFQLRPPLLDEGVVHGFSVAGCSPRGFLARVSALLHFTFASEAAAPAATRERGGTRLKQAGGARLYALSPHAGRT